MSIDEVNAKKMLPVFTVLRLTDDADILNSVAAIATPLKVMILLTLDTTRSLLFNMLVSL